MRAVITSCTTRFVWVVLGISLTATTTAQTDNAYSSSPATDRLVYNSWSKGHTNVTTAAGSSAASQARTCTRSGDHCRPGILLPIWMPTGNISTGDTVARAIVYFLGLCYLFLGISIISDRFMAAIEVITSKEKEVIIKKPLTNEEFVVKVRIWNETVSNLTLMALGSSAPEILLSIIEVIGNNFEAGDLGPGTIVGSAAFNLFVIIAVCVYVVPDGVTKRIKHLRVFFITAAWSIFAYVWMYMILALTSPGEVEVWEGILTFFFFPLTVLTAWIADRKIFPHRFLTKRYRASKHKRVILQIEGKTDVEMEANHLKESNNGEVTFADEQPQDALREEMNLFESHRQEYIQILRELRKKHANIDMAQLEEMAQYEVINRGPKSRAFYRIQATRKLTGGGNLVKQRIERENKKMAEEALAPEIANDSHLGRVFFEPAHYTVMENVGSFEVAVRREGGNLGSTLLVDYASHDGTATAGSDYVAVQGTVTFLPGETTATFEVTIIDDDVFEEDEHFSLVLSNVRCKGETSAADDSAAELGTPAIATVMILDDDHCGIFHFDTTEQEISESAGEIHVKVVRGSGSRGTVSIPFKTIDGTARNGKDFVAARGLLEFLNNEHTKTIAVQIMNAEEYQKDAVFYVELGEPKLVLTAKDDNSESGGKVPDEPPSQDRSTMSEEEKVAELGRPRLGEIYRTRIRIKESSEFKTTVDKLLKKSNTSALVGTSSWKEQFMDAITVSSGDDDDDNKASDSDEEQAEADETRVPSCGDYVSHYLSLFWKVLFAFVPPTDYFGGWASFVVSIIMIGFLTAVVGDLANHFGCTIGLKDAVTAISFVALGTSLPDTFASKVAAMHDEYADSSIGNVTGSNAVNVFLGIGIAWSVAAIKHAINGTKFAVKAGSLAFAVTLFCVFAFLSIAVLLVRRRPFIGGELGGPRKYKILTSMFMVLLWAIYILISALEYYCYIKGF